MALLAPTKDSEHHSDLVMYSNVIPLKQGDDKNKPVSLTPTQDSKKSGNMSNQEAMAITYQMLMALAIDMGEINKGSNEIQQGQAQASQAEAKATDKNTQDYLAKIKASQQESFWQKFADAFKWIGLAVAFVVGALLCETPAGFVILVALLALTASGLLNKGIDALGSVIGKAIGNNTAGNILAEIIGVVVITVISCGADTAGSIAMAASRAGTEAAETAGTQIAERVATQVAEDVAEGAASATTNAVEDGASTATNSLSDGAEESAENAASEAAENTPKDKLSILKDSLKSSMKSYTTRTAFINSLCSSGLIQQVVAQAIEHIPGNSDAKQIAEAVISAVIMVAVSFASMYGISGETAFVNRFTSMIPKLRNAIFAVQGASSAVGNVANGGAGYAKYQSGQILASAAPILTEIDRSHELSQIFSGLTKQTQQATESQIKSLQSIFSINFGAGWQAAAQGLA